MAKVRAKLKELRNAEVTFISLVDRAASRIPFRVLKRDKESEMIDLTKVFKKESKVEPGITAIVVYAQKEEKLTDTIRKAITDAGFKTDRVQKNDDETLVYAQGDAAKNTVLVRLSDQMVASVKNLGDVPGGLYGKVIKEQGFYPGMSMAVGVLHEELMDLVAKGDMAAVPKTIEEFNAYTQVLLSLPEAVFKADAGVNAAVPEHKDTGTEVKNPPQIVEKKPADGEVKTEEVPNLQASGGTSTVEKVEESKDKKPEDKKPEDKEKVEESKDKKPVEEVKKTDMQLVLDAIKGVETSLTTKVEEVATKVESVVQEQSTFKKALDGVVAKAETLEGKLKTTVVAGANNEDRPAGTHLTTVQKDDDPRRGCFDTAFIPRSQRRR